VKLLTEKQLSDLLKEAFTEGWKCGQVFDHETDSVDHHIDRVVDDLMKRV